MSEDRLKVIRGGDNSISHPYSLNLNNKEEAQAKFERIWLRDPEQFDPTRNCMEKERTERTWNLIVNQIDLKGKRVIDLGCGSGHFSRLLRDQGAIVDALDISANALKAFSEKGAEGIEVIQGYVPQTLLNDRTYDLVLAFDLIAHLHRNEHRLFFAELARLVKPDGSVVCSTPLNYRSENPLEKFAALAETEFIIEEWVLSNFSWYIAINDFFQAPYRFVKASQDKEYRKAKLKERNTLNYYWFKINSSKIMGSIWKVLGIPFAAIANFLRKSRHILLLKEKAAKFISENTTVSHAIFIGKRRPLMKPFPQKDTSERQLGKKEIWE